MSFFEQIYSSNPILWNNIGFLLLFNSSVYILLRIVGKIIISIKPAFLYQYGIVSGSIEHINTTDERHRNWSAEESLKTLGMKYVIIDFSEQRILSMDPKTMRFEVVVAMLLEKVPNGLKTVVIYKRTALGILFYGIVVSSVLYMFPIKMILHSYLMNGYFKFVWIVGLAVMFVFILGSFLYIIREIWNRDKLVCEAILKDFHEQDIEGWKG
jgi:hypothetical protein